MSERATPAGPEDDEPILVTRPPKPVSEMTDEERRAYAREVVDAVRKRHGK
jgi:hypothetical protein